MSSENKVRNILCIGLEENDFEVVSGFLRHETLFNCDIVQSESYIRSNTPDLVLMDIDSMAKDDVKDIQMLLSSVAKIPIVYMSSSIVPILYSDLTQFVEYHVSKPLIPDLLRVELSKVNKLLDSSGDNGDAFERAKIEFFK